MAEDLENQQNDKIIQINIEEQMKSAYIDYSMSVIVSRALPDVRDGLKPVHRRVLYGMLDLGVTSNKPHKKLNKFHQFIQQLWRDQLLPFCDHFWNHKS